MPRVPTLLLGLGLSLCACAAKAELAVRFDDETPSYVTPGALDCVVPILLDKGKDGQLLGSGIVMAPDVVLTAGHVVGAENATGAPISLVVDGVATTATLLGVGSREEPHGDWALLQLADLVSSPIARIHGPAREPGWRPAPGTDVLMVGYARGFFVGSSSGGITISADAPTPCVKGVFEDGGEGRRWLAATAPLYLGGMSGGAAMVWDIEEQRAEVVGVVTSFVPVLTTRRTTRTVYVPGESPRVFTSEARTVPYEISRLPELVTRPGRR